MATPEDFTASSFDATVARVKGDDVALGVMGSTFDWKVGSPSVNAMLTRNLGEQVRVHWELRGTEVTVVGVDGPNGSIEPPTDA